MTEKKIPRSLNVSAIKSPNFEIDNISVLSPRINIKKPNLDHGKGMLYSESTQVLNNVNLNLNDQEFKLPQITSPRGIGSGLNGENNLFNLNS
jgi:hypothetical protein